MPTKKGPADTRPSKQARAAAAKGDDAGTRGDRSKRLLDLVMSAPARATPVTFREIREQFAAYQTANVEAGLRAFERDKADLLELGVPIRYITPDEDDSLEDGGYVIDLKRFRLPEVQLTADEVSALVLAASVARAVPGGTTRRSSTSRSRSSPSTCPSRPTRRPSSRARPRRATVLVHFPEQRAAPRAARSASASRRSRPRRRYRKRVTLPYQAAATGMARGARSIRTGCSIARALAPGRLLPPAPGRALVPARPHERRGVAPKPKTPDFERPADFDVARTPTARRGRSVRAGRGGRARDVRRGGGGRPTRTSGPTAVKRQDGDRTLVAFACGNPEFAVSRILAAKGAIRVRGDRAARRLADELDAIVLDADHVPVAALGAGEADDAALGGSDRGAGRGRDVEPVVVAAPARPVAGGDHALDRTAQSQRAAGAVAGGRRGDRAGRGSVGGRGRARGVAADRERLAGRPLLAAGRRVARAVLAGAAGRVRRVATAERGLARAAGLAGGARSLLALAQDHRDAAVARARRGRRLLESEQRGPRCRPDDAVGVEPVAGLEVEHRRLGHRTKEAVDRDAELALDLRHRVAAAAELERHLRPGGAAVDCAVGGRRLGDVDARPAEAEAGGGEQAAGRAGDHQRA